MPSVKTAISMPESTFREADRLAKRMRIPRSRFFAQAVEAYVRRWKDRQIMQRLNEVHKGPPDAEDKAFLEASHRLLAKLTERDRW
jgi:predicted transcriptional regulator